MIFKIYKRRVRDEIYDNYKFYQILPALCPRSTQMNSSNLTRVYHPGSRFQLGA